MLIICEPIHICMLGKRMKVVKMKIKYWGVRGSIPTPSTGGKETGKYGGNTSCLEVVAEGERYILDAGSGLRMLGQELMKDGYAPGGNGKATILLGHFHWDHIDGFPFFVPAYIAGNSFDIYGPKNGVPENTKSVTEEVFRKQQSEYVFPITIDRMGAEFNFRDLEDGEKLDRKAKVSCIELNHPGGVLSYRIEENGRSFVYASDYEHSDGTDEKLVEWARNADVLVYDGQYTPEEYETYKGRGHSTYERGIDIASAANVATLVLTHHDPTHDDKTLDAILQRAKDYAKTKNKNLQVMLAYEGLEQVL